MFKTVQEASARWIAEGKAYKGKLNDWLDTLYIDKQRPETDCPAETRKDMSDYVLEQIVAYNQQGNQAALRQLFPPDNDPFNWESIAECVTQVAVLPNDRLAVTVGDWRGRRVYVIDNDKFALQENIFMFGKSADKKFFAKVTATEITITEGWDGAVVKTLHAPQNYGAAFKEKHPNIRDGLAKLSLAEFGIAQVIVFPSGQRVAMASEKGIFIIDEKDAQFIQTQNDDDIEAVDDFTFRYAYPHVDISSDEKYLVVGTQISPHLLLQEIDDVWTEVANVEPRSSYPNLALFNDKIQDEGEVNDGPQVLLCSCHFSRSATLSLPLKNVVAGFTASGYDADDTLNYVDDKKWIFSAANYSWGYALGDNHGYIWFKEYTGMQHGYLHIGGTIMDLDFSADRNKLIVATYSGQVVIFDCENTLFSLDELFRHEGNRTEKRPDEYAVTNTCYVDVKRYLFWHGHDPMVW